MFISVLPVTMFIACVPVHGTYVSLIGIDGCSLRNAVKSVNKLFRPYPMCSRVRITVPFGEGNFTNYKECLFSLHQVVNDY